MSPHGPRPVRGVARMTSEAGERLRRALALQVLEPVVAGLSFVDPALLPGVGAGGRARPPADVLARACGELRLDFAFVPSCEPWAAEAVAALHDAEVAALWAVPGVLTPMLERRGAAEAFRGIARGAAWVDAELEDAARAAARAIAAGIDAGADAIVVADDLAGADGPLVSPSFLDAAVFPRLAGLAALAEAAGLPAILHCDGDTDALYASVRAAGFAAVHGDRGGGGRTAAALAAARGAGVALIGGIAAADLGGGPARGATAGTAAAAVALGGGLLVCDDGGVATAAECAALLAALGAARR